VMNEQRKVIYKRRDQILEGTDLKAEGSEYLAEAVDATIETYCVSDADDEWNLDGLLAELQGFYPTELNVEQLQACTSTDQIYDLVMTEATAYYAKREEELTPELMREVERHVMLQIVDQRWREHLSEMDYLQEGINLRAMGQKDPLVEWQAEGFSMFGQMIKGISQDFIRYIMHVQVVQQEQEPAAVQNVTYSAPDESVPSGLAAAAVGMVDESTGAPVAVAEEAPVLQQPVVLSEMDRTPRNAPCPCGSGKKYKLCHGRS